MNHQGKFRINWLATGWNFIQVNGATLGHPDLEVLLGKLFCI